ENDKHLLRYGMYGRVSILLETPADALRVPSSAIVGEVTDGKGAVFVCRDGVAHRVPVYVGRDNGLQIEVSEGLTTADLVATHPSDSLRNLSAVVVVQSDDSHDSATEKSAAAREH